ncbi:DUF5054 domain-containing protein [Rhizobium leguminosarum]|uniref:DUF5054 domain-containing protein n=1 Tax=Rhizobium leguminosarum TaxID=384 RepID=A0A4Q8Y0R1_RHILE|nr:DUF5054 domain-containing protein [Rhizobium leguminosarum]TAU84608.1 DUF5054 domain-containing protein [Rhizobium leguminosarum]TAV90437.1 DUF5054 domain-containing protein [Rhizobium leguminosarum]TAV95042.1 DUF5054 domain-containing protein [Rhizobium leguminosarum]TAW36120.1 DUF5054 domain-containing protein [Rhizobium leguminosarum]TAX10738.1 DUF5054 domain-containing protein [Rhizobium leguminosarum]
MTEKRVHLVFKTHLDIGFTDHAEKVRRQYHERFIPQAIETGKHFHAENPDEPKFIWTTGAWLIWDHLNSRSAGEVAALEQAIERGLIRWHGLPFTTHTELMSPDLFRAGLSYSQELDRRFGKTTIAAKMTDVPGHTLGMVPLLSEAGIRFLHLGVNTASPPPDVPDIFRWRAPGGEEVVVMYQRSYGETCFPDGFEDGLSFAHTNDNMGPQSVPQTAEAYRELRAREPDAVIRAATLEDYGAILWSKRERFPVVELELGDSWIHGSGSDPVKTARFLALQRLYDRFAKDGLDARRLAFGRGLAMVAEHTCGVDIKSYLRDDKAWSRADFEAARRSDYRFAYTEASWDEQRAYLDHAVSELAETDRKAAQAVLAEFAAPAVVEGVGRELGLQAGGWSIALDSASGDVAAITSPSGRTISGRDGSLIAYRYESYDAGDVIRHMETYLTHRQEWAVLDHDKPGLAQSGAALSKVFLPGLEATDGAGILLSMPAEAVQKYGAPPHVMLHFIAEGDRLDLRLSLHDKPANRMPEASFLSFTPDRAADWNFRKMGLWHRSGNIATSGGGQLQAVTSARCDLADGSLTIETLDAPLVAPQSSDFMTFCRTLPDFTAGIRFNLHNNKWGTNFPMWWQGDFQARFRLSLD